MKEAKKFLILFYLTLALFVLTLATSIGGLVVSGTLRKRAYNQYIGVSAATEIGKRQQSYIAALQLCPGEVEPYLLLLRTYGEDGRFTKAESEEFLAIYNANHNEIRPGKARGTLHAEIGLLYINGYEDTPTMQLRMALPFFEIAQQEDNGTAVACYVQIGRYYQEYIWTAGIKEVPADKMNALMGEINAMLDELEASSEPDTAFNSVGFATAVCDLLYSQRDILAMTVPQSTVIAVLDRIYKNLPDAEKLQAAASKDMVTMLLGNKDMYYSMIKRAYSKKGVA